MTTDDDGRGVPPWMPHALDATDLAIVEALRANGRASFQGMAGEMGIAEATVRKRVNRLLDEDIIQIVAVPTARAYEQALMGQAMVKFNGDPREAGMKISEWPEVTWLNLTTGQAAFLLEFVCSGRQAFLEFVQRLHSVPGVLRAEISVYLKTLKQTYVGPLNPDPRAASGRDASAPTAVPDVDE
jgi:Lrp/AsnC family transcriptional regulator for asnA, asnC and gidA